MAHLAVRATGGGVEGSSWDDVASGEDGTVTVVLVQGIKAIGTIQDGTSRRQYWRWSKDSICCTDSMIPFKSY